MNNYENMQRMSDEIWDIGRKLDELAEGECVCGSVSFASTCDTCQCQTNCPPRLPYCNQFCADCLGIYDAIYDKLEEQQRE